MKKSRSLKIDLYHNIKWSRYKAGIFNQLHEITKNSDTHFDFTQIADTRSERLGLSEVDDSLHRYPHKVLFSGNYDEVPKFQLILTLIKRVMFSQSDIILIPGYHKVEYWAMLIFARLSGKQCGVFCDSTLNDRKQKNRNRLLKIAFFKLCRVFFAYGTRSKELLLSCGAPDEQVFHPCQAADLIDGYTPAEAYKQRLSSPTKGFRLLFVGRLSPEKSVDNLIESFSNLKLSFSDSELIVVGSGPELENLKTLVARLKLTDSVHFTGAKNQKEIVDYYLGSSCLVLPSACEPWGLVVNEALHHGCPVVVSDRCGCVPELVVEGVTGYSFSYGDVKDLTNKLQLVHMQLANKEQVALSCIERACEYLPESAARSILRGCESVAQA